MASPSRLTFAVPVVAGIGNALMAVPLVRQLKRGFPEGRVVVSARTKPMSEVFERLPECDEVRLMGQGSLGMFRSMQEISRLRPEAFIVPFPSNRWQYMALAVASGARRRILHSYPVGRMRTLGFLPAERLPAVRGLHDVLQNLYLLRLMGIEPDSTDRPTFPLTEQDRTSAAEGLASIDLAPDTEPIAIHAGSATTVLAKAKRWPPERYARLLHLLQARYPANPVVVLEGPDEAGIADQILERYREGAPPKVLKLRGTLASGAAVLERSRLYVGTDSGLAHLSAAVGTPAVTLFAPADPDRVCPYGYRHLVVQPGCSCCPSFLYPFQSTYPKLKDDNTKCIEKITPEQVMSVVEREMVGRAKPSSAA